MLSAGSVAKSAFAALLTRGVFTCRVCRALDARRALRYDLATVLLKDEIDTVLRTTKDTYNNDFSKGKNDHSC